MMTDCKLILEAKDGKILIRAENTGILEMAEMCGVLEQTVGLAAYHGGMPLEDIKSNMLDIHLAAMDALTDQAIRERGGHVEKDSLCLQPVRGRNHGGGDAHHSVFL